VEEFQLNTFVLKKAKGGGGGVSLYLGLDFSKRIVLSQRSIAQVPKLHYVDMILVRVAPSLPSLNC
jgi:hypothetical protein